MVAANQHRSTIATLTHTYIYIFSYHIIHLIISYTYICTQTDPDKQVSWNCILKAKKLKTTSTFTVPEWISQVYSSAAMFLAKTNQVCCTSSSWFVCASVCKCHCCACTQKDSWHYFVCMCAHTHTHQRTQIHTCRCWGLEAWPCLVAAETNAPLWS